MPRRNLSPNHMSTSHTSRMHCVMKYNLSNQKNQHEKLCRNRNKFSFFIIFASYRSFVNGAWALSISVLWSECDFHVQFMGGSFERWHNIYLQMLVILILLLELYMEDTFYNKIWNKKLLLGENSLDCFGDHWRNNVWLTLSCTIQDRIRFSSSDIIKNKNKRNKKETTKVHKNDVCMCGGYVHYDYCYY